MKKLTIPLLFFSAVILGGCTLQINPPANVPNLTPTITLTSTPTVTFTPTASPTPSVDEMSTIKAAVKKALVVEHGDSANELNITVSKISGDFSQGGASASGGGGMWFAAKVNGDWKLVWDGNGTILCTDLTAYPNFPTSMIPECYDQAGNKTVKR